MNFITKTFGINVKKWRNIRGLRQEDLADLLSIHANTVGRIERGEHFCKPETIDKIARVLQIKPSDLFMTNSKNFFLILPDWVITIQDTLHVSS